MNNTGRPKGARTRERIYKLKKKLILRGYRSINNWAERHGFNAHTAHKTISRYYGFSDLKPQGEKGIRIMTALDATLKRPEVVIHDRKIRTPGDESEGWVNSYHESAAWG